MQRVRVIYHTGIGDYGSIDLLPYLDYCIIKGNSPAIKWCFKGIADILIIIQLLMSHLKISNYNRDLWRGKMVYEVKNTGTVKHIFGKWEETLIWSCLQGIMGKIYVTSLDIPVSAMAIIGDFIFYAGEPDKELVSYKPGWCKQDFIIMVPQNDEWESLIEQNYGEKAKAVVRYALKKEMGIFDQEKLQQVVSALSDDYALCLIDEKFYEMCKSEQWSSDLVSQFKNYNEYKESGLGVVIVRNGTIVAGASSYSRYHEGIEIRKKHIDEKDSLISVAQN